jgi:hypothetical protein
MLHPSPISSSFMVTNTNNVSSLYAARWIHSKPSHPIPLRSIFVHSWQLSLSSKQHQVPRLNFLYVSNICYMRATSLAYLILFLMVTNTNNVSSLYAAFPRLQYRPPSMVQIFSSNRLNVWSYRKVRDQFSYQSKTAGKFKLYLFLFLYSHKRRAI